MLWHDAPNKPAANFRLTPLKVTKWRPGKDFHDLKQVFCGFLAIIQHFVGHSSTGPVKVNSTRQNEKSK